MLNDSWLPHEFCNEAISHSNWLLNRLPFTALDINFPFNIWYQTNPNLKNVFKFWQIAPHQPPKRSSFQVPIPSLCRYGTSRAFIPHLHLYLPLHDCVQIKSIFPKTTLHDHLLIFFFKVSPNTARISIILMKWTNLRLQRRT